MSDPSKKSNYEAGDEQSRGHEAMNVDATFVPEPPADSPQEETDYSATITGMPLPVDDDEEFDSQRFDDGTSNSDMATFVPADEESDGEACLLSLNLQKTVQRPWFRIRSANTAKAIRSPER
jgi:hypothetical protein